MAGGLTLQLLIALLLARGAVAILRQELRQRGIERLVRRAGPGTRLISREGRMGWVIDMTVGDATGGECAKPAVCEQLRPQDDTRA